MDMGDAIIGEEAICPGCGRRFIVNADTATRVVRDLGPGKLDVSVYHSRCLPDSVRSPRQLRDAANKPWREE